MTTAALIREMLTHAGLTQTELARRLGLSRISVVRWCTGAVDPSASALLRIARECGYVIKKIGGTGAARNTRAVTPARLPKLESERPPPRQRRATPPSD